MLDIRDTALPDVKLIAPRRFSDARGTFFEAWSRAAWRAAGIDADFVQDNQSQSLAAGTVRGLHFQVDPVAQGKLVRVLRGAIFDVVVDIRRDRPDFGRFATVVLSAENGLQLYVPAGFAHGFCTLEPDSEVLYKVTAPYSPAHERGILWSDPGLAIPWPVARDGAILSDRDRAHPPLATALGAGD
jgi:dTDP-4-dehydrorhamnose 3,5-epimerase